jgi:hypothetical protein
MLMGLVRKTKPAPPPAPIVTLEGQQARAQLPEGAVASLPLADLMEKLVPSLPDSRGAVLPDGVKLLRATARGGCILVHQTPPRVHQFRWIAPESPSEYGPGTIYRTVRLALPYLVVFAVFQRGPGGMPCLSQRNECFFVNDPLDRRGLETELCYPALLNCSRYPDSPENPVAWICTQHLGRAARGRRSSVDASLRAGLSALLRHLLESGFNLSSERHELNSWFTETVAAAVDPRIASVEAWEQATAENPLFVLEVPWLPTGHTLGSLTERIAGFLGGSRTVAAAGDVARIIVNHQSRSQA